MISSHAQCKPLAPTVHGEVGGMTILLSFTLSFMLLLPISSAAALSTSSLGFRVRLLTHEP